MLTFDILPFRIKENKQKINFLKQGPGTTTFAQESAWFSNGVGSKIFLSEAMTEIAVTTLCS